jgi:heme-binding NEAT domain protein
VAKQAISVDVNQQISITAALQEAQRRVLDVVEVISEDTSMDRRLSVPPVAVQSVD